MVFRDYEEIQAGIHSWIFYTYTMQPRFHSNVFLNTSHTIGKFSSWQSDDIFLSFSPKLIGFVIHINSL